MWDSAVLKSCLDEALSSDPLLFIMYSINNLFFFFKVSFLDHHDLQAYEHLCMLGVQCYHTLIFLNEVSTLVHWVFPSQCAPFMGWLYEQNLKLHLSLILCFVALCSTCI